MMFPGHFFFIISKILFCIGVMGAIANRGHLITMLISVEIIMLSAIVNFSGVASSTTGAIASIIVITVAAAEAAIALAIVVLYFKKKGNISVVEMDKLRG